MKTNKKVLAATLAAAVLVTGTFAWQSFSQEATNEIIESVAAAGGRLHDYFDGSTKEVFVENYSGADDEGTDVYARIRLSEYFEYGKNAGTTDATDVTIVRGDLQESTPTFGDDTTWDIYKFGSEAVEGEESIRTYRDLAFSGDTTYLPTYNLDNEGADKDLAEVNGTYRDDAGEVISYDNYVEFTEGEKYDEDKAESTDTDAHKAAATETSTVISMADWLTAGAPVGDTWVYDEDGWAYYAAPIAPQTASGLLLNAIKITSNVSEEWYYAVNVTAQLATAGDWGKADDADSASSMYASTMSDKGVYVLNKAAGIVTVENMVITVDGEIPTLEDIDLTNYTAPIVVGAKLDVINGMGLEGDKAVTMTSDVDGVDNLFDASTGRLTIGDNSTDVTITVTSVLDDSKSVEIIFKAAE